MTAHLRSARLLNSPYFLWVLLALPAVFMTYNYVQGALFYGELLHETGELGARLLIVALAVTPLRLMFPTAGWVRWLLRRRRYIGVAAFGYSLLHAVVYIERQGKLAVIVEDALEIAMWTGWLALAVLLALAATSNDTSLRILRRGWKWLHRCVYAAAVLTFAHWILSAFDPIPATIHLGVLSALEGFRVWKTYLNRGRAVQTLPSAD